MRSTPIKKFDTLHDLAMHNIEQAYRYGTKEDVNRARKKAIQTDFLRMGMIRPKKKITSLADIDI